MTDYYIDPSLGAGNGGNGTTEALAFGDLSDATIGSNNNYYFKRGEEQLCSGTGDVFNFTGLSTITVGAYGDGAKPILNGLTDISGYTWTSQGSNRYTTPLVAPGTKAIGDTTHVRERVFISRVGQAQATNEYFDEGGTETVDATYPVYWDGTDLWLYSTVNPSTLQIETILDIYLFNLGTGDDITFQDIDVYGMRICAETLTANVTSLTFNNFRNLYCQMTRSAITLTGTSAYKLSGFTFTNSVLDKYLQPYEEPYSATCADRTSFGSNDGINLYNNIGSTAGGTLGEITISNFQINGFGHTGIKLQSVQHASTNHVCIRNCLIENGLFDGTNSNHSRGFAIGGYECTDNIVRNIREYHTRSVSKCSGQDNLYYNLIYDTPLVDWSPNACSATDNGGGLFPDNSLELTSTPTWAASGGIRIFNITFLNSENAPIHAQVGALNNVSDSDPIYFDNIIFDECATAPNDNGVARTCIFLGGTNYTKSHGLVWNGIRAYHTAGVPIFRDIDSGGSGNNLEAAAWTDVVTGADYNATDVSVSDSGIDSTFTPSTGGGAYNAGTVVYADYDPIDYYGRPRPGMGAWNAPDVGAVEVQDDAAFSNPSPKHYSLRRKIEV